MSRRRVKESKPRALIKFTSFKLGQEACSKLTFTLTTRQVLVVYVLLLSSWSYFIALCSTHSTRYPILLTRSVFGSRLKCSTQSSLNSPTTTALQEFNPISICHSVLFVFFPFMFSSICLLHVL